MNRLYVLIPLVLLGLFGGVYYQHAQSEAATATTNAAATVLARRQVAAEKQAIENKAKADAEQRLAALRAEEQKQADDKRAKWDAESARLAADTADTETGATALAAQLASLETQLATLRATKDQLGRDTFELEKSVTQAQITKRIAELEIQRLTAMLAREAAATEVPPLPPAAPEDQAPAAHLKTGP